MNKQNMNKQNIKKTDSLSQKIKNDLIKPDKMNQDQVGEIWDKIKKQGFTNEKTIVKSSLGKGLGVFAKSKIKKGEIIEYCHLMTLAWKSNYVFDQSVKQYAYWGNCPCDDCIRHGNTGMILFGNGSIYNSAESEDSKNLSVSLYPKIKLAVLTADKDIQQNEEILTWFGQNYYDNWCKNPYEDTKSS